MKNRWVWAVLLGGGLACQKKDVDQPAPSASISVQAPVASSPASAGKVSSAGGCLTELDYLVPPQKYGDSDLVRAIVVDGGDVYFRNLGEVFRVPLAGGAPVPHSKGPGLTLSGRTVLWAAGERLLTQSASEPIFMAAAKAGGEWTTFIDLTAAKRGGGRDAATRILQNLGRAANAPRASRASFDGDTFYWSEISGGKGTKVAASSTVKSIPLAGGEPRTLYQGVGEISEVVKAGDRVVFMRTAPPSPEQLQKQQAERKAKKLVFGVNGASELLSIPAAGGQPKTLLRISNWMTNAVLGVDAANVYVTGYLDEDASKPGIYRVQASGAGAVEQLDQRALNGSLFVSGERLIFIGEGFLEPGKVEQGQLVLSAARDGKSLTRAACISDRQTLHAIAVTGKTALLGLFKTGVGLASIAKIPLP